MFDLFLAELKRSWVMFKRYPSEAITMLITFTVIFLLLFLGAKYMSGPTAQFGDRLDAIIVGYLLWSLALIGLANMGWALQAEAQTGTLEQVFLSCYSATRVFFIRVVADLLLQFGLILLVMVVILWITGRHLDFSLAVLPPVLAVLLSTWGLGFVLGGLTLLFKRIQNLLQLSQFFLIFLIMIPVENWHGALGLLGDFIPLAPGAGVLRNLMARGIPVGLEQLAIALLNGLAYLGLGILFFQLAERRAKIRGSLGGY